MKIVSYLIIISFTLACLFISCSNDSNGIENKYTSEELAKIKLLENMFIEHGWELDSTISQEVRNDMLLTADIEETRLFLDNFCFDNSETK